MKNIPLQISKVCSSLVGTPYESLHCWEVVRTFYSQVYGVELYQYLTLIPKYDDLSDIVKACCEKDFDEVVGGRPVVGDILVINLMGWACHIAVFIGEGKILHTTKHSGCVVEPYSKWSKSLVGIYRIKKHDNF